jgi:hypothetical protein
MAVSPGQGCGFSPCEHIAKCGKLAWGITLVGRAVEQVEQAAWVGTPSGRFIFYSAARLRAVIP